MKALPLFLALLLIGCQEQTKTPKTPYSYIAPGDPPDSFEVTNISNNSMGPDATIWVQAEIAPEIVENVIKTGAFSKNAKREDLSGMNPPDWWIGGDQEQKFEYYEKKRFHSKHTNILTELKVLWVNQDSGILYFTYITL